MAITTDAAALHARVSNTGRLERVCLVDGTVCRFDGAAPVTITDPGGMADLEVRFDQEGAPVVATSRPREGLTITLDAQSRPRPGGDAPPVVQPVLQQRISCVESPASPTR